MSVQSQRTSGRTITFPGFLRAYVETVDELEGGQADDEPNQDYRRDAEEEDDGIESRAI